MAQQTAVEWLAEELKTKGHALITTKGVFINIPNELLKQAKEMEKEQIVKAHGNKTSKHIQKGVHLYLTRTGENYYNQTYIE